MSTLNIRMGPALRYDTVDLASYTWHGFALIVTHDATSDYAVTPTLRLQWQPARSHANGDDSAVVEETAHASSEAIRLWRYDGPDGSFTFWRFKLEVPLADYEQQVTYSLDGQAHPDSQPPAVTEGTSNSFFVPAKTQDFRWIGHSCNGFSASIDTAEWNGPNPLWDDVVREHHRQPFHAVVGGGDQIYNDKLTREPEMQPWVHCPDAKERIAMPLTEEIAKCIDRYLFNHYCEWFGTGTFSKVIASVPMLNMLDDHDLIDGFGTYPDDLMMAPVFNAIGSRGYFFYLLFQQFINIEIDDTTRADPQGGRSSGHSNRSVIVGEPGAYIPFPNQSFLAYMGPRQWILLIDCRSERKVQQICTKGSYERIFSRVISDLPEGVEHLVILLGVPLAYPRMVFLERALSSPYNPLIMIAKGLSPGFVNSFNGQVELLDDLNDHWCAAGHKRERNSLVCRVQEVALEKHLRVSWISGDVHAGGVGMFHGYHSHDPAMDPKMSLAVITSAIVNAPPPPALISLLNKLATKRHRSLFYAGTKETMVPVFDEDLQGNKQKDKYIIGARNWCAVTLDAQTSELEFELRVEKTKGSGEVKPYPVRSPPPRWNVAKEKHHLLHRRDFEKEVGILKEKVTGGKKKEQKQSDDPVLRATAS